MNTPKLSNRVFKAYGESNRMFAVEVPLCEALAAFIDRSAVCVNLNVTYVDKAGKTRKCKLQNVEATVEHVLRPAFWTGRFGFPESMFSPGPTTFANQHAAKFDLDGATIVDAEWEFHIPQVNYELNKARAFLYAELFQR